MNIAASLAEWVVRKQPLFESLTGVSIVTMGDQDDLSPPFLGIAETGSDIHETNGVIMAGVTDFEVVCELVTVPATEDQEGTPTETSAEMRRDIYAIIGDRAAIDWMTDRNEWRVFDIRLAASTTEASEGRLIARWNLSITACPI